MKRMLSLLLLGALGACSTAPGTGWSRAGDLSTYGAMHVFARAAIDQEAYCFGRDPALTLADWERDFAARQQAVTQVLIGRYGAERTDEARLVYAPRVACGDIHDPQWRIRYTRMLRLLETRFRLQAGGES
ncbi:MAG TPA: hypothetical protein VMG08_14060 [Allosphingosinicella sp.]|nr:hypothetical protein [Allosphingosinicella sp.]